MTGASSRGCLSPEASSRAPRRDHAHLPYMHSRHTHLPLEIPKGCLNGAARMRWPSLSHYQSPDSVSSSSAQFQSLLLTTRPPDDNTQDTMAIILHNAGSALATASNPRWKSLAFSTTLLVLVFLVLFSQPFLFDGPRPEDRTHSSKKLHSSQGVLDVAEGQDRPLVVYAYAESPNAKENLEFFLKRGLHARADFVFIFNGETEAHKLVPALANVKVVHRNNTCYDMGALGEVLAKDRLWQNYKRFITLNASIRGPFLPIWSDDCWTDVFLNRITEKVKVREVPLPCLALSHPHPGTDRQTTRWISQELNPARAHTQLVGLTYQCAPSPHVQSMLLATDYTGMQILLDPALAYSVPLNTWPWGGPELPTGYSVCYADYGQAVSRV